jgi:hypothetical protein
MSSTLVETIMNMRIGRTLLSVAALAASLLSAATNAGENESEALDQCIQAFVNEVAPANHPVQIRRDDILASTIRNASGSRMNLVARGEKYGKRFGRATCVMDGNGSLVATYVYGPRVDLASTGRPKVIRGNG